MAQLQQVLVVDDNQTNCEVIQEMLADEYDVLTATNGLDALAMAEQHQPDIVLLDFMLPGINGLEVCQRLRHLSKMSRTRIIIVSAKAMPSERAQGLAAGANAYITKPFDYSDLMTAIRANEVASA
jgi:two-component system, cell cycle response regulator